MRLCWLFMWAMQFISVFVNDAGCQIRGMAVAYVDHMEYRMTAVFVQIKKQMEWEINDGTFTSTREIEFS